MKQTITHSYFRRYLICCVVFLIYGTINASIHAIGDPTNQQRTISGKITDTDGVPLAGVNIFEKGTSNGTASDFDGNYEIVVGKASGTLVFSYIGFQTISKEFNDQATIDVVMNEEANQLEELVIVGYSKVSREDLTSSVATVKSEQIKDIPLNTAAQAIQGRLAGVRVTQSQGAPGAEVSIRVRGGTSITQDNSPLYIVDGIQVDDALSILSPQEIASVDVLKDAASTAIYGARGANGVILITTKSGFNAPTKVTYSGFAGVREITNKLDVMNPYQFVKHQYEVYNIYGGEEAARNFERRYGTYADLENYRNIDAIDWQDEIFGRSAFSYNNNLSVTGGDKRTDFSIDLNAMEEDGIMINSGYKRKLANFKMNHKISDAVKVGANVRFSKRLITGIGTSSTQSNSANRLRNAVRFQPFESATGSSFDNQFDADYASQTNLVSPLVLVNNEIKEDQRDDLYLNGYFQWEIIDNLTFKSVFGYVQNDRQQNIFNGRGSYRSRINADLPVVQMSDQQSRKLTNSNTLQYDFRLGEKNKFNVLLGQEIVKTDGESQSLEVKWLPEDITPSQAFANIQSAVPPEGGIQDAPSTSVNIDRLASFFGRVGYTFDQKYVANFTIRTDGSTVFSPNNRYAVFPAASFAWNIGKENFLQESRWVDDLKLRLSYGTSGNNRIRPFLYSTFFTSSSDYGYSYTSSIIPGLAAGSILANPNTKWETTKTKNIGLDYTLFNNRVYGSIDAYITDTDDLLLLANIPQTSGYSYQYQNTGSTRNTGVELNLGADIISNDNFKWSANLNISHNNNEIRSLGTDVTGEGLQYYYERSGWVNNLNDFKVEVGKPVGQFYGFVTDGWYTLDDFNYNETDQSYTLKEGVPNGSQAALGAKEVKPGDLKLKDLSGDGIIGEEDKTVLGNAQPDFYGGFNQQLQWKNFDMSVFFTFSVGNDVYNANKIEFTTDYNYTDNNSLAIVSDSWRNFDDSGQRVTNPDELASLNQNAQLWTPSRGNYILHSWAIEDGSYLRLSNLTLGYSINEDWLKKSNVVSNIRIYGTVNNLFTLTGYSGYDPEANTRNSNPLTPGVDYAAYPQSRFILGGINITF
ncbi:SusC/RagA family TonB-linked outer membrane protein [Zunongwangia sp. HGR-M22]|uniref:SusC/RagA family TonB-linked outer membrane protein n=1 Tax=Zunongwangia sp. HGR-M22 TaxID=3015168 RepID=UPI0022DE6D77|nr:TonB-dependent receptor [Zunongwangia sp. HGR-M22]WBL24724.1 TonB-dependent receptor [Zunongwangia sp. HGR-M22]